MARDVGATPNGAVPKVLSSRWALKGLATGARRFSRPEKSPSSPRRSTQVEFARPADLAGVRRRSLQLSVIAAIRRYLGGDREPSRVGRLFGRAATRHRDWNGSVTRIGSPDKAKQPGCPETLSAAVRTNRPPQRSWERLGSNGRYKPRRTMSRASATGLGRPRGDSGGEDEVFGPRRGVPPSSARRCRVFPAPASSTNRTVPKTGTRLAGVANPGMAGRRCGGPAMRGQGGISAWPSWVQLRPRLQPGFQRRPRRVVSHAGAEATLRSTRPRAGRGRYLTALRRSDWQPTELAGVLRVTSEAPANLCTAAGCYGMLSVPGARM